MAKEDEALTFLLHCIKHTNHGKVDFAAVAREFGAVSKGAAAKRYERLVRSHGPDRRQRSTDRATSLSPRKEKSNSELAKSAEEKRRKLEADHPSVFSRDQGKDSRCKNSKANLFETPSPFIKNEPTLFGYRPMMHSPMPPPQPPPVFFAYPPHLHSISGPSNFYPPAPYTSSNDPFQTPGHIPVQSALNPNQTISTPSNLTSHTPIHPPAASFASGFRPPPAFPPTLPNSDKNMVWDQAQPLATTSVDDKSCVPRIEDFWTTGSNQGDLSEALGPSLQPIIPPRHVPLCPQEVVSATVESINDAQVKEESDDDCIFIID